MLTRKILTRRLLPAMAAVVMSATFSTAFADEFSKLNSLTNKYPKNLSDVKASAIQLNKKMAKVRNKSLPDYYPSVFSNRGVVQKIDGIGKTIMINGTRYHIYGNTKVHTLFKEQGSTYNISKNDHVGFSYTENDEKNRFLDDIWILPKGSVKGN